MATALQRRLRRLERKARAARLGSRRHGEGPGGGGTAATLGSAVSTISHEMREPLNGVLGVARLLEDTPLDDEQKEYVGAILASAEALVGLVNDVLDLSRIEAGGLPIQPVPFALRAFLDRVGSIMAPRARQKGLSFRVRVEDSIPDLVEGDPARLRQVLLNLLGNAVKFTETGEILLAVEPGPEASDGRLSLRIRVVDTGPGISSVALARLFRPFAQAEAATGRLYGGSGLGLVIARRIVEAMGGRLHCASTSTIGTSFTIDLVLGRPQAEIGESLTGSPELSGARLLIVDPVERTRETMRDLAVAWGMSVRTARAASAAQALLAEAADRRDPFDIVLLDAGLPDGGAETLARALLGAPASAASEQQGGTRLVLLASSGLRGDAARARAAGFAAYLPKPATAATLLDCLRQLRAGAGSAQLLTVHRMHERKAPPLEVLVTDDNALNCRLLTLLLERAGHRVTTAASGEAAVAMLGIRSFDIVLMDVQMPGIDGLEAARRIRALSDRDRASVPIVAVTANALRGDDERCREAGMDAYLTKPIDGAALVGCVERWGRPSRSAA